jgi:acylphosphatase
MSDDNDDLAENLAPYAETPKVKGIIDRLPDADVEVLKQWTDATYSKRLEPRQAAERQNQEYRQRVAGMSRTEFELELAKLK